MSETNPTTKSTTTPLEDDLARLIGLSSRLGLTDAALEVAAGLSPGYLTRARRGEKRGERATPSKERLRALLVTKLGPAVVEGALSPRKAVAASPAAKEAPDLAAEIAAIRTQEQLRAAVQRLASEAIAGSLETRRAELGLEMLKVLGPALEREVEEKGRAALMALEVLDAEEAEWLTARRAGETPKGLRPGESGAVAVATPVAGTAT